jgi:hypothetical protein
MVTHILSVSCFKAGKNLNANLNVDGVIECNKPPLPDATV